MMGKVELIFLVVLNPKWCRNVCALPESMTHFCTLNPNSSKVAELKLHHPSTTVITPAWVVKCHKLGKLIPIEQLSALS
jgi:hypothetical protein